MNTRTRILRVLYTLRFVAAGALLCSMIAGALGAAEATQIASASGGATVAIFVKAAHLI